MLKETKYVAVLRTTLGRKRFETAIRTVVNVFYGTKIVAIYKLPRLYRLERSIPCAFCKATGKDPNSVLTDRPCPVCSGAGKNRWVMDYSDAATLAR